MKCILKVVRFLVRPFKKRGFSRVDLVILLFLGIVVIVDLLLHAFQPSGITRASQPALAQVQAQNTNRQVDAPSSSLVGAAFHAPASPHISSSSQGIPTPPMLSCVTNVSVRYTAPSGRVQSPFGKNDFLFFFTDPGITVDACYIQNISAVMVTIVNAFVVIIFLLAGLRIILGGSVLRYASAIEILPGILLALLAANLCLPIARLSLDLENSLTSFTYGWLGDMAPTNVTFDGHDVVTQTCNHWDTLAGAEIGNLLGPLGLITGGIIGESIGCNVDPYVKNWQQTLQKVAQPPNITGGASPTGFMFAFQSLTDLLQFVTGMMALMLMGQMAIRILFIDFYISTGPLGMGAWALPGNGGKLLTRLWLQGFFTTLFVQFLQVVALIIVRLLIGIITSGLYASFNGPDASYVNGDATLLWVMQIAQYWFLLRIPALLRLGPSSPMNMITGFGQTMVQTAQTALGITMAEIQFTTSVVTSAVSAGIALAR